MVALKCIKGYISIPYVFSTQTGIEERTSGTPEFKCIRNCNFCGLVGVGYEFG